MLKHLLNSSLKGAAVAVLALAACASAQAEDVSLYLSDVATEAELTSDVFGVPMAIDKVGDKYVARYYNQKAKYATPTHWLLVSISSAKATRPKRCL